MRKACRVGSKYIYKKKILYKLKCFFNHESKKMILNPKELI